MSRFSGFPARSHFTPVPNPFFSQLLPQVDSLAELKLTLHLIFRIYQKKGFPRLVTLSELKVDGALLQSLGGEASLYDALKAALARGSLIALKLEREGWEEELYLLNTEEGRRAAERLKGGEVALEGLVAATDLEPGKEPPNIFALYEENIGLLTPLIADELKEAEERYPAGWIEAAFAEAVALNRRSWRYVARILERWAREGRGDATDRRHLRGDDPDKYIRGRYGHLVKR